MWFLTTLDWKSQPSANDKGILELLNFFTVVGYFDSRIAIPIKPLKMFSVQTKYEWKLRSQLLDYCEMGG